MRSVIVGPCRAEEDERVEYGALLFEEVISIGDAIAALLDIFESEWSDNV